MGFCSKSDQSPKMATLFVVAVVSGCFSCVQTFSYSGWMINSYFADMLDELLKVDQLDINSADELKRTALHWAASVNNHIGCKQLLYKGAKVDVQDESAQTPLFLAAKEGNFEAARELLDHKASPELADDMDKLPRDIAVERMHKSIVRLLDEHKEVVPSPPQVKEPLTVADEAFPKAFPYFAEFVQKLCPGAVGQYHWSSHSSPLHQ